MTQAEHGRRRAVAVYTDVDDLDVSEARKLLEDSGVETRLLGTRDPARIALEAADADVLMSGYATVDDELLAALPDLGMVSLLSMGTDTVDIDAANRRGVWVANIQGVATQEVAEHALALALAAARRLQPARAAVEAGRWSDVDAPAPVRLGACTLGLVGLGRIGLRLAELARPLFERVVACDPLIPPGSPRAVELAADGVEVMDLRGVASAADVLSLHVPLTPETEQMVDERFLAGVKRGSVLVNVSRGGLIDRSALCSALDGGILAAAALDVLEEEPPARDHPLLSRPDVLITPHMGYLSLATRRLYPLAQAENALAWLETGRPLTPAPGSLPQIRNGAPDAQARTA